MSDHRVYATSTEYVDVPVSTDVADPTTDPIQMAFIPPTQLEPGSGDWHPAIWTTVGTRFLASCLVGPGAGGVTLLAGRYQVFWRVTDNPEIPVKRAPNMLRII